MEEISSLKADKTKEKGSWHDPEYVAYKEEAPVGSGPQNIEQCIATMADITTLLEQERAEAPKERFYARRPPNPLRILSKPNLERYELRTFAQYEGRRGSAVKHVSKFIDTLSFYAVDAGLCLREFFKSLCDRAWYTCLKPGLISTWDDMLDVFCIKYFHGRETVMLATLQGTK